MTETTNSKKLEEFWKQIYLSVIQGAMNSGNIQSLIHYDLKYMTDLSSSARYLADNAVGSLRDRIEEKDTFNLN